MKTNFFKIVMPAATILLAVGGSFASHASEKKTTINVPGYVILPGDPICRNLTTCQNITATVLCTVIYQGNSYMAFSKQAPSDMVCDMFTWRLIP